MPLTAIENSATADGASIPSIDGDLLDAMNPEQLASAFEQFSSVSSQLADTYQAMEQKVGLLNEELHDLAEKRLAELQEKERVSQRLESLLKLLPAGVVVLDSRGVISDCNPAAIDLLGEPLIGELWRVVIDRSFAPQSDDGHEISLKDGRQISLATRSFGSEGGQLMLLTDLTETRQLQRDLSRHQRLSEMGRMMSSLAHQIRTPLSAAMLYAGHLCHSSLTADQNMRFSQKILSRLNHLEQQVKDMLIFVKGEVKLTDRVSMKELMADLELAMEVPMASASATYSLDLQCPSAVVVCNRESIVGALMNLVNNAIQAAGGGAVLAISVMQGTHEDLSIAIVDHGPGISPRVMANLEEPFYTTKAHGTGLGLSVVKAIAVAHHGSFELISEPGQGCQALMTLPVLEQGLRPQPAPVEYRGGEQYAVK